MPNTTSEADASPSTGADTAGTDADAASTSGNVSQAHCGPSFDDLGQLDTGDTATVSRQMGPASGDHAACASGADSAGAYTLAFTVAQAAILDVQISSADPNAPVFELRKASCATADGALYCADRPGYRAVVEPDTPYFLRVEGAADTVDEPFHLTYKLEHLECMPGEATCSAGSFDQCVQGTSTRSYACAADCADAASCQGDACADALEVAVPADGSPAHVQGDRQAYADHFDATALQGCEPTGSPGAMDLFMHVTGLHAGTTLTVTNTATGSYVYYVLDTCAATSCRASMFVDPDGDNRLQWQVPADGDYIIVAEALSNTGRPFAFDVAAH